MSGGAPTIGDEQRWDDAARLLLEARRTGTTIAALPPAVTPQSFADGYRIQDRLLALDGRDIGLIKIGCTTAETQRIMNLDEPIGGCLAAESVHAAGAVLAADSFHHQPLIECEFAMRLAADIAPTRSFPSSAEAMAMADAVAPALELVDGRFHDQLGIAGPSVVADNSMATAAVIGRAIELGDNFDPGHLAATTVTLAAVDPVDGSEQRLAQGVGANVLGDPWRSFHWALQHLAARGRTVAAGTWIITGSCAGAPVAPLDCRLLARFDGLGDVSVTIADRLRANS